MSEVVVFPIKMSKLLKKFKKKPRLEFLCHAAKKIHKKKTGIENSTVRTSSTFDGLKRIMPDFIADNRNGIVLQDWVRDLPADLQMLQGNSDDREFRIQFLTWAIEKFGDQEINFEVYIA